MDNLEFHFFHGFLGAPKDWDQTLKKMPKNWNFFCHDLLLDTANFSNDQSYFKQWVDLKVKEFANPKKDRILIGYSLGGRLIMSLPEACYKKAIYIASHPGLDTEREERLKSDQFWVERMMQVNWIDWIRAWNEQDVFKNDKNRPDRIEQFKNKEQWQKILFMFSLAQQENNLEKLKSKAYKSHWGCGELDEVYLNIKKRLSKILKPSHLFQIKNSGHGVIFDQPDLLSNEIIRIMNENI
jgi:pimeloyl-ACP methyl ester carboxylesterase